MTAWVQQQGYSVNAKRVRRVWRQRGLMAVSPKPRLRQPDVGAQLSPYLLTGRTIDRSDHVWSTDLTYVRRSPGFVYLVAMMDW